MKRLTFYRIKCVQASHSVDRNFVAGAGILGGLAGIAGGVALLVASRGGSARVSASAVTAGANMVRGPAAAALAVAGTGAAATSVAAPAAAASVAAGVAPSTATTIALVAASAVPTVALLEASISQGSIFSSGDDDLYLKVWTNDKNGRVWPKSGDVSITSNQFLEIDDFSFELGESDTIHLKIYDSDSGGDDDLGGIILDHRVSVGTYEAAIERKDQGSLYLLWYQVTEVSPPMDDKFFEMFDED